MSHRSARRIKLAVGGLVVAACLIVTTAVVMHSRLEVSDASSVRVDTSTVPKPLNPRVNTVAFVGDSYTAGSGSDGYNHAFATLLAAYEGWRFRNFAYGGTGYVTSVTTNAKKGCGIAFCPQYDAVLPQVSSYDPTVVVVSGGRNDVGKPDATVSAGVTAFYRALRRTLPKAQIIATSPLWDARQPPAGLRREQVAVRRAVEAVHGTYLNLKDPLEGHSELISSDGVHPNDDGHGVIARDIEVAISRNAKLAIALKTGT